MPFIHFLPSNYQKFPCYRFVCNIVSLFDISKISSCRDLFLFCNSWVFDAYEKCQIDIPRYQSSPFLPSLSPRKHSFPSDPSQRSYSRAV